MTNKITALDFAATLDGSVFIPGKPMLSDEQQQQARASDFLVVYIRRAIYSGHPILEASGSFTISSESLFLSLTPIGFWGEKEDKAWNDLGVFKDLLPIIPAISILTAADPHTKTSLKLANLENVTDPNFRIMTAEGEWYTTGTVIDMADVRQVLSN